MEQPTGIEAQRQYGKFLRHGFTPRKVRRDLLKRIRHAVMSGAVDVVPRPEDVDRATGPAVTAEALAAVVFGLLPDPERPLPRPGDPDGGDCLGGDWRARMPALFAALFPPGVRPPAPHTEADEPEDGPC